MSSPDTDKQREICNTESLTLIANKIQKLVELPLRVQIVNLDQVFKLKLKLDNTIISLELLQETIYDSLIMTILKSFLLSFVLHLYVYTSN